MITTHVLQFICIPVEDNTNEPSVILEPLLFGEFENAVDYIFNLLWPELVANKFKQIASFINANPCLEGRTFSYLFDNLRNHHEKHKKQMIDAYVAYCNENGFKAVFSITERPTQSLIEQLNQADAIEIDGCFIRHFALDFSDHDTVLNVSMVEEEFVERKFCFSLTQLTYEAKFNTTYRYWEVDGHKIELYKFSQELNYDPLAKCKI